MASKTFFDDAEVPAGMRSKKAEEMGSNVKIPDKVRILLEDNDKVPPGGQFFGINGKSFLLQAGVEVNVPRGIIDVLDNAIEEVPIIDPNNMQIRRYAKRLRFPYRNLGPVTDEPQRSA